MRLDHISRILLYPFSLLYALSVGARNLLYDSGLLKSTKFNIPVINVGNLSVGGAGKTPHVEYLATLLESYLNVSILSRGYKRKSKGFKIVKTQNDAYFAGDEPLQYKRKYPELRVAVSESRALGIPQLLKSYPEINVVLLDDAFQHRSVTADLNVLLTPQNDLFIDDMLLPAGRLREFKSAYKRAHLIIVTKCDNNLEEYGKQEITKKLNLLPHQKIFFSKYVYGKPYFLFNGNQKVQSLKELNIILISAIANTDYLIEHLENEVASINALSYEDHHYFSDRDMQYLKKIYDNSEKDKTIILTTEKDAIRLELQKQFIIRNKLPIFALPVVVDFLFDSKESFDRSIKDFLLNYKV